MSREKKFYLLINLIALIVNNFINFANASHYKHVHRGLRFYLIKISFN